MLLVQRLVPDLQASMSLVRAKDELDAKDYCKMLKGNIGKIRESEYNVISMEKLVETYRGFFVDVAERTQRMWQVT